MTMKWNEEQKELRALATRLGPQLNAGVLDDDENAEFPRTKWDMLRALGFASLPIGTQFGGLGCDVVTTMCVLEELGHACDDAGLGFTLASHIVSTAVPIERFGTPEQRERFLPRLCLGELIGAHAITEPDSGSDAFSMRTRARREGDEFVISGRKTFITNAPIAGLFVLYARTDCGSALSGVTAFLIEKDLPGLSISPPTRKMGLRTSPLADVVFDECRVGAERVLGKVGGGFSLFNWVMKWEVLCSFALNVGQMQKQLETCIEYSRTRKQFGKPISDNQAISHKIVNMKIALETSRLALYHAGSCFQRGESASVELALAKIVTSENHVQSSLDAMQIFGAYGYAKESPVERDLRNAVASRIYSGTSEIQRNIVAQLLGL